MKPGYKTTEFWFTLATFIVSGLFLLGLFRDESQKDELIIVISHAIESIFLIGGQVMIFLRYMQGRREEKLIRVYNEVEHDDSSIYSTERPEPDNKRIDPARSSKTNYRSKNLS
tara:strand:- start:3125 stop:3466 length:342 start_codon:yes stop_codon:yes gene_type:complete